MPEDKTKPTRVSPATFVGKIGNAQTRKDCRELVALMRDVTGHPPKMWGASIVGFDQYHYKYASGREGDWFLTGFSPRKSSLTLYIMSGFSSYDDLLGKLGKHKTGKSCLYINRLEDVDLDVLRRLVETSVAHVKRREKAENA